MFSQTITALKQFDNQHDFERMSADILNASGYKNVVLIAPRGGSDGGKDITFTTEAGKTGLACVTLRKDIDRKFEEDFSQREAGEFDIYMLFCIAYLTASQKSKYTHFCSTILDAQFVPKDIEALRSILDSSMQSVRDKYLYPVSPLDLSPNHAKVIADAILEKLGRMPQVNGLDERSIMDWLIEEAHMLNGKVNVGLGDIPGVKHSMRMMRSIFSTTSGGIICSKGRRINVSNTFTATEKKKICICRCNRRRSFNHCIRRYSCCLHQ